jgi:prophage regulatory protein
MKLIRKPSVLNHTAQSNSGLYVDIDDGLFTKPVKIGLRAVAWPEHEVQAVIAARIAGRSEIEIRQLVVDLHAKRKEAA